MSDGSKGRILVNKKHAAVLVVLFALSCTGLALMCRDLQHEGLFFPIRFVRIEGEIENVDAQRLRTAVLSTVNTGFFSLPIADVETAARSYPWVDKVQVVRLWPDTLVLRISEQKPVARWGDHDLINQRGERFAPDRADSFGELPMIVGPAGKEKHLLGLINALNNRLRNRGLSVTYLDMSKRRACIVRLNSGMEVHFGRQDPVKSLDRFLELVPQIGAERMAAVQRVDLRYPNGFAVVWKPDAAISDMPAGRDNGRNFLLSALPIT